MIINIHIDSRRKRFDAIGVPVPVPGLESKVEKCCVSGSLQVSFFVKVGRLLGKRCCDLSSPSVSQSFATVLPVFPSVSEREGGGRVRDGGGGGELCFLRSVFLKSYPCMYYLHPLYSSVFLSLPL